MKTAKKLSAFLLAAVIALGVALPAFGGLPPTTAPPLYDDVLDRTYETNGEIVVNGEIIEAPLPTVDGFNGTILVPLRAVAEALGLTITWNGADRSILVDGNEISIKMWIDGSYYSESGQTSLDFGPSPQLIDGYTYVPFYFFRELFEFDAYIFEGQIVFDENVEEMR
jgi:hypothetical protein